MKSLGDWEIARKRTNDAKSVATMNSISSFQSVTAKTAKALQALDDHSFCPGPGSEKRSGGQRHRYHAWLLSFNGLPVYPSQVIFHRKLGCRLESDKGNIVQQRIPCTVPMLSRGLVAIPSVRVFCQSSSADDSYQWPASRHFVNRPFTVCNVFSGFPLEWG